MRLSWVFVLLSACFFPSLNAQVATYHRVQINLEGKTVRELAAVGLEVDHGQYAPQRHLINDFSTEELRQVQEAGFTYEILIEDVVDYYKNPARQAEYRTNNSRGGYPCTDSQIITTTPPTTPSNFRLGSMAGHFTYTEMLDILDSMRLLYPNLISSRRVVAPDIVTHQNRPIYWLRISDNPDTDETTEPEVLYTALHHAREPNSLTQMIYYMWYILENYENSDEIRYLVDNTELYFMPCVNPDGYIFNENNNPDGGGMWRKNLRNNGDGSTGVDLNRNYGFNWGFDNFGSSPNPNSDVYRGPAAFSEPETQAVAALCNEHEFLATLNYHTHGNLLIYPWGYSDQPTPDASTFNTLSKVMTLENNYLAGTGTETVGYVVNGDSDDWMYGETGTKPSIFSMTPEVGGDGFWPAQENIIPNCENAFWMNLAIANFPHRAVRAIGDPSQFTISSSAPKVRFELTRYGLQDGPVTVGLESLQPSLLQVAEEPKIFDLMPNETTLDSFVLQIVDNIPNGTIVEFALVMDNGSFTRIDTISRVFGDYNDEAILAENFNSLSSWSTTEDWSITNEDFVSAPNSLTDSPFGNHDNNTFAVAELVDAIEIGDAEQYQLNFWAKWEIEAFYDWAQVQYSINDGNWTAACARYTVEGSNFQDQNQPVWEGESDWVEEVVDFTGLVQAGDQIRIRFLMVSDQAVELDGIYIDDLAFVERNTGPVSTETLLAASDFAWRLLPNPTSSNTSLRLRTPNELAGIVNWEIMDTQGRPALAGEAVLPSGMGQVELPTQQLLPGLYLVHLRIGDQRLPAQKLVIAR